MSHESTKPNEKEQSKESKFLRSVVIGALALIGIVTISKII